MNAFKMDTDSTHYRMATAGCGVERWMEIGRTLLTFEPIGVGWNSPTFFWQSNELPIGDFFGTGDPALLGINYSAKRSPNVWRALEAAGELLPIMIDGFGEALLLHVTHTRKGVNLAQSSTQKLSNGKIVVVVPVLEAAALGVGDVLRLEDWPLHVILTESESGGSLRQDYARHQLTGLNFEMVRMA